mmetsp:Transcript_36941/g.89635  ORF Transcript_36941/g.89635 Transcript_36941/m.89635 type:complete len:216 (-) Transcript_36941:1094-1741(-)
MVYRMFHNSIPAGPRDDENGTSIALYTCGEQMPLNPNTRRETSSGCLKHYGWHGTSGVAVWGLSTGLGLLGQIPSVLSHRRRNYHYYLYRHYCRFHHRGCPRNRRGNQTAPDVSHRFHLRRFQQPASAVRRRHPHVYPPCKYDRTQTLTVAEPARPVWRTRHRTSSTASGQHLMGTQFHFVSTRGPLLGTTLLMVPLTMCWHYPAARHLCQNRPA